MGFGDVIYNVLIYSVVLFMVWGYAIAYYFGATGQLVYGGGEDYKFQSLPGETIPEAWQSTDLLREGIGLEYGSFRHI